MRVLRISWLAVSSLGMPAACRRRASESSSALSLAAARNQGVMAISTSKSLRSKALPSPKPAAKPFASSLIAACWALYAAWFSAKPKSPGSDGGSRGSAPISDCHQNLTVADAKRGSATIWRASHCRLLSLSGAWRPSNPGARMSRYQVSPA